MTCNSPSILIYHPTPKAKKGEKLPVGTVKHDPYFTFRGGNQNIALNKDEAVVCKKFLGEENADDLIAAVLKRPATDHWIKEEAEELGHTLVQVIEAVVNYKKEVTRVITTAEGPERLASFIAKLDPEKDPDQLGEHLKEWIESDLPEAIVYLKKCLATHKRSPKTNYIRLRAEAA